MLRSQSCAQAWADGEVLSAGEATRKIIPTAVPGREGGLRVSPSSGGVWTSPETGRRIGRTSEFVFLEEGGLCRGGGVVLCDWATSAIFFVGCSCVHRFISLLRTVFCIYWQAVCLADFDSSWHGVFYIVEEFNYFLFGIYKDERGIRALSFSWGRIV